MNLTDSQREAIGARGNVLVIAGAGTGKTRTLVERCVQCLLDEKPPVSLDEILMVTFTEAAAAEMRQRIRERLETEWQRQPDNVRWREQLALFDTAHIGTLHGFCHRLVREHFYERGLELDPQLKVMSEEEAQLQAGETLDLVLRRHYAAQDAAAEAVRALIQTQGRGWDKPVRTLVLKLHHYTQTLPDPGAWLAEQRQLFESPEPVRWREWLLDAGESWRTEWVPVLESLTPENGKAVECGAILNGLKKNPAATALAETLNALAGAEKTWPRGKKTAWEKPLKKFFREAAFLRSLLPASGAKDPLAEDWEWARGPMLALVELAQEFSAAFTEAKRELGLLDFHDLEGYALRLLWDHTTNQPTALARQWQRKLRFVFVDEYQDINAAQDRIIQALSRDGAAANRFLVGDVKQSIYRFRQANPRIFQAYAESWKGQRGETIPLQDNFRSRESVLQFVNSFFGLVMKPESGGMNYDERAALHFGAPAERHALSLAGNPAPVVELHWRIRQRDGSASGEESVPGAAEIAELRDADKEARLAAARLRELKLQRHPVWDEEARAFRAVDWRDMAVLLRSPSKKAESYAREFARSGVPLVVARGGFYASQEVMDWLNLLQLLDNPLQDVPALAVLRSPLVGLTLDELAEIRLTAGKVHFWTALLRWHESKSAIRNPQSAISRVSVFLERFFRWRRLARQSSLSQCLETALAETRYAEWLLAQPRGKQRHANLRQLAGLARQFDHFQRQGLFRFLRFVEAQQAAETEPDVPSVGEENAVRLMSIHQSKGLEFPVVVLADLAKGFNFSDSKADIILDEEYGLCPQIRAPGSGRAYPSLPFWLARRRHEHEVPAEELRLLYVAMTRARDALILTASIGERKLETWADEAGSAALPLAKSAADWIGRWFVRYCAPEAAPGSSGENNLVRWWVHAEGAHNSVETPQSELAVSSTDAGIDAATAARLRQRLEWRYPFASAATESAKISVTALRRRQAATADDESQPRFAAPPGDQSRRPRTPVSGADAAEIGTAHHRFLQFASLERLAAGANVREEAQRLVEAQLLTTDAATVLDFDALADFWSSPLGSDILARRDLVRRELPFTARFAATEVAATPAAPAPSGLAGEFVVVQGVADLAVLLPGEIWLVDFKTDAVNGAGLEERVRLYAPQLRWYARALAGVYRKPVRKCWLHFLSARTTRAIQI